MPEDVPVRLRPRAIVPAGWPADVSPNQIITAAHINAIRSSVYAWPGDVDGQGHTLSNVHIAGATGVMLDPTTTAGDLIARGASALERLPAGANGQVLAVDTALPGKLTWATPATAPVLSVFGRLGAVVAQAGDYTAAQVTGAVVDALTTRGDIFARGAAATGRFPAGADGQVLRADPSQAFGLRWSGESVPSVFGRTGPIAAQAGDYAAADVTNAVSVLGSYPDPAWLPSLSWGKLIGTPATFAPAPHTHDAAAIASGVLATARLGTGVADATVYLRGDGTWAAAGTGGGGGVVSVFGRAGAVVAQTGDYTAAQVTGAVVNPTSIKGDLMVRNDLNSIVRLPVGASGQVLQADPAVTVGMKWTNLTAAVQTPWVTDVDAANFQLLNVRRLGVAMGLPAYPLDVVGDINFTGTLRQNGVAVSFGGSQTPWASDIDAAGFKLNNAGNIGIGAVAPIQTAGAGRAYLTIKGATDGGCLELATGSADSDGTLLGQVAFSDPLVSVAEKRAVAINALRSGTTANNRGGLIQFFTKPDAGALTERMRITAAGQVGIGATAPATLLEIGGTVGTAVTLNPNATTSLIQLKTNGTSRGYFGYAPMGPGGIAVLDPAGSGNALMMITASGNVGIGTVNPGFFLSLGGGIANRKLAVYDNGSDFFGFGVSGGQFRYDSGAGSDHVFYTSGGATERMRIMASGNVGIGTTAPTQRLHVASPPTTGDVNTARQIHAGTDGNPAYGVSVGWYYTGAVHAGVIQSFNGAPGGALLLNPSGGLVGIGTTNPADLLTIGGIAYSANSNGGIRIQSAGAEWTMRMALKSDGAGIPRGAFEFGGIEIAALNGVGLAIKKAAAGYPLDVTGDINYTGTLRQNGTPVSFGGGGGVTTKSVVTGSRASATPYTNSSGKPMFVSATFTMTGGYMIAYSDTSATPGTVVASAGALGTNTVYVSVNFWVLPGDKYMISAGSGTPTVFSWTEWT